MPRQSSFNLRRRVRDHLKAAWHKLFLGFERLGIHITPVHFYGGLPNVAYLRAHQQDWLTRSELPGVSADVDAQIAHLQAACLPFQPEYADLAIYHSAVQRNGEAGYGPIESQALHGFIRFFRPRRIVQVGCGVATYCLLEAVERNGSECKIVCIEPFPNASLRDSRTIELIAQPVQRVPTSVFTDLGPNDVLFIDSTHVVQVGSDVNFLVLEIMPRLPMGVLIQFHDIYLPFDYPRNFLDTLVFPLETSLVRYSSTIVHWKSSRA
jgi:hypothetical protein